MAGTGVQGLGTIAQIWEKLKGTKMGTALGVGAGVGVAANFSDEILGSVKNAFAPFTKPGEWLQGLIENTKQNEMFSSTTTAVRNAFVGVFEFVKVVRDIFTGQINIGDILSGKTNASTAFSSEQARDVDAAALAAAKAGGPGGTTPGAPAPGGIAGFVQPVEDFIPDFIDGGNSALAATEAVAVGGAALVGGKMALDKIKPPVTPLTLKSTPAATGFLGWVDDIAKKIPGKWGTVATAAAAAVVGTTVALSPTPAAADTGIVPTTGDALVQDASVINTSGGTGVVVDGTTAHVDAATLTLTDNFDGVRATGIGLNGIYEGAIEGVGTTFGAPVDFINWAVDQIPGVEMSQTPFLGSAFLKSVMGGTYQAYADNLAPGLNAQPQNLAEMAIGGTGYTAGWLAGSFTGAGALGATTKAVTPLAGQATKVENATTQVINNSFMLSPQ